MKRLREFGMKVFWKDAEKTILIREALETLVWEEYKLGIQKMVEMIHEVSHDVYLIIDASRVQFVPKDSISHFSAANENMPAQVVMRILVTKNTLVKTLTRTTQKVVPDNFQNFYYADTMDEAYEKIAEDKRKREGTVD
jgi:hypothetical protein